MSLNTDELTVFLANVISVARLDGVLTPAEEAAIETIRQDLGMKKADAVRAFRLAESANFSAQPVGRFSDRVRNLEDMLFLALVDGELASEETVAAVSFSRSIGLADDQLRQLVPDAERRAGLARGSAVCAGCGANLPAGSRFCPGCGSPQNATPSVVATQVDFSIPPTGWAVEFAESTSVGFPKALEKARTSTGFQNVQRAKKNWYLAAWPDEAFGDVIELSELLRGFRNRRVFHDGKDLTWEDVFGFSWCAGRRNAAFKPDEYCFGRDENRINPWGCRMLGFDWAEWANWFAYGSFQRGGPSGQVTWVFDKERLRHELDTHLHGVRFCPHVRPDLISVVVETLPSRVLMTPNGPWKYRYASEDTPGAIKVVEAERIGDRTFEREYFSAAIEPRSPDLLREILTVAFSRVGIKSPSVRELVP